MFLFSVFFVNTTDLIHQILMFLNAGVENPNHIGKLICILSPSSEIEVLQSDLSKIESISAFHGCVGSAITPVKSSLQLSL